MGEWCLVHLGDGDCFLGATSGSLSAENTGRDYYISDEQCTCPCSCKLRRPGQVRVVKPCAYDGYDIMLNLSTCMMKPSKINSLLTSNVWYTDCYCLQWQHFNLPHSLWLITALVLAFFCRALAILKFLPMYFGGLKCSETSKDLAWSEIGRKNLVSKNKCIKQHLLYNQGKVSIMMMSDKLLWLFVIS